MTGHEYVTEGRPEIKVPENYWEKEYARQRKDRMQDAIDDYLQDEKVDPRQAYEEILSCIQDVISHHKKNLKKSEELRDLMLGYRPVDLNLPERY